jgi:hypothetical protein
MRSGQALTNRIAPRDLSGYTLLTQLANRLHGAVWYVQPEGLDCLIPYIITAALFSVVKEYKEAPSWVR